MTGDIEQLMQIRLTIERLLIQVGRLESNTESEKGTIKRTRDELRQEIDMLEQKVHEILFAPDKGLLIQMDRLVQESERRRKLQAVVISQGVILFGILIKFFLDWIGKR